MYWIVTDATADLPLDYVSNQENFHVVNMSFTVDGEDHKPDGTVAYSKRIYEYLRSGKVLTTSQINTESWKQEFRALLDGGNDILCIAFSSGLSGTCLAAKQAAESLQAEYPERRLMVVDSFAASMGEGLLVDYALRNRAAGMSLEDNAAWVEQHCQNIAHWFTVDDLMFLLRGGRVSAASAYLGSMLKIKPVLDVDAEGHLIPREKVQGRKRSVRKLFEHVKAEAVDIANQRVFISHGDCEADANLLAGMLRDELGVKDITIGYIGPIIGSHSGPGTLAVFFYAENRI